MAANKTSSQPPVCDICNLGGPTVRCTLCGYRFCTTSCLAVAPDPDIAEYFECPDCLGNEDIFSENATRLYRDQSAAVLIISLQGFEVEGEFLRQGVQGALMAGGVKVTHRECNLDATIKGWAMSDVEWLNSLPTNSPLFAFLVTETVYGEGWIHTIEDEEPHCDTEDRVLTVLFAKDKRIAQNIGCLRQSILFVVSCGGNYLTLDERPSMKTWVDRSGVFKSVFGFLNPRLSMAQLPGFFMNFVTSICIDARPVASAVVEAYTRDEYIMAHTDIVWFNSQRVVVYRHSPMTSRPWGIDLPSVDAVCKCDPLDPRWKGHKRWIAGSQSASTPPQIILPFKTNCCGMKLTVFFPEGAPPVSRHANVTFLRALWPATVPHYFEHGVVTRPE